MFKKSNLKPMKTVLFKCKIINTCPCGRRGKNPCGLHDTLSLAQLAGNGIRSHSRNHDKHWGARVGNILQRGGYNILPFRGAPRGNRGHGYNIARMIY